MESVMPRRMKAAVLASTAVMLVACSSLSNPTATTAKVDLTANPNPTSALPSSGVFYTIVGDATHPDQTKPYPWQTQFSVTMAETAGVGLDITSISVKVQQAAGGIITPPHERADRALPVHLAVLGEPAGGARDGGGGLRRLVRPPEPGAGGGDHRHRHLPGQEGREQPDRRRLVHQPGDGSSPMR